MAHSERDYDSFWSQADTDGSGSLTMDELQAVLQGNGYDPDQVRSAWDSADMDADGKITKDEYTKVMQGGRINHAEAYWVKKFQVFDDNRDGHINCEELEKVMKEAMGDDYDTARVNRIFEMMDADKDGKVPYKEFVKKFGPSS